MSNNPTPRPTPRPNPTGAHDRTQTNESDFAADRGFPARESLDWAPPPVGPAGGSGWARGAALVRTLAHAEQTVRDAEARFRVAVDRHATDGVKVMGWVHDALLVRNDPAGAATLLYAWHDAGGALTRERGAADLAELCGAARDYLVARSRADFLRRANRPAFADESEAPIVA